MNIRADLEAFVSDLPRSTLAKRIAVRLAIDLEVATDRLDTYLNETFVGLNIARRGLAAGRRILEVGSGIGALALFLRSKGYNITALEPGGTGFDFIAVAREELLNVLPHVNLPILSIGVEALDPEIHGQFDFIFSVHVLEHVPNVGAAISAMGRVLADNGEMVHVCPNYAMPYDPHFAIPLIPMVPALTRFMLPSRITRSDLWCSINFITAGMVKREARRAGLGVQFQKGVLRDTFARLETDPLFAKRHRGIGMFIYHALKATGGTRWLGRVPAEISSPMIFEMRRL